MTLVIKTINTSIFHPFRHDKKVKENKNFERKK